MNQYENLNKAAKLLGADMDKYYSAKEAFFKDKYMCIADYLGYEDDGEIQEFAQFWYYYLADNTNCFFHNVGAKGYVKVIKKYLNNNEVKMNYVDFDDYGEKESYYSETLFDILVSDVRYNMVDKTMDIFGLNVGYESMIYYVLPKETLKQLKAMDDFIVFDCQKLEEIYGEIYKLKTEIKDAPDVKIGDFVEKIPNEEDSYSTLFDNKTRQNYTIESIPTDKMELYL